MGRNLHALEHGMRMNIGEKDEPPIQDSKGTRSHVGDSGTGARYIHRVPVWRGGYLPGMVLYRDTRIGSLFQHSLVGLGHGEND